MLRTREQELEMENQKLRAELYGTASTSPQRAYAVNECNAAQQGMAGRAETPEETIDYLFTFHDDPDKTPHYVEIREAAKAFAKVIIRHTPPCGDRVLAIQHVREAVMFSNASVALSGRA
jgi:hypothetical protein